MQEGTATIIGIGRHHQANPMRDVRDSWSRPPPAERAVPHRPSAAPPAGRASGDRSAPAPGGSAARPAAACGRGARAHRAVEPDAGAPGLRHRALLRRSRAARPRPLSGQSGRARAVARRVHRCARLQRDAAGRRCHGRDDAGPGHPRRQPDAPNQARRGCAVTTPRRPTAAATAAARSPPAACRPRTRPTSRCAGRRSCRCWSGRSAA